MKTATLEQKILACTLCESVLPLGAKPLLQLNSNAKLLIIGQAPGKQTHISGQVFNDLSGDRLRDWLGLSKQVFYSELVSIVPMGFCYPGRGKSGDLAPDQRCYKQWHTSVMAQLQQVALTLLVGQYAQKAYLTKPCSSLTKNVAHWQEYLPNVCPLPHPSPRNQPWLSKNAWFEQALLPELKLRIKRLLEC